MTWQTVCITALCALAALPALAKQHPTTIEKASETASLTECFFLPPKDWEIADPKTLSPKVKIAFVKNTGKGFCPSINLAVEQTQALPNEYLKAVKAIHEQDRTNRWRALGKVHTAAGLAQLTEIDSTTEWGPIRLLQLLLVKDGNAYVLTAAALKEEFSDFYREFQSAFRSLTLSRDLPANIPQFERRENLKTRQQQLFGAAESALQSTPGIKSLLEDSHFHKTHWIPFQEAVLCHFSDMGAFWQVLVLRETQEKLMALKVPDAVPETPPETDRQNTPPEIQSGSSSLPLETTR